MFDDDDDDEVVDVVGDRGGRVPTWAIVACRGVCSGANASVELNRLDRTRNSKDRMVKSVSF